MISKVTFASSSFFIFWTWLEIEKLFFMSTLSILKYWFQFFLKFFYMCIAHCAMIYKQSLNLLYRKVFDKFHFLNISDIKLMILVFFSNQGSWFSSPTEENERNHCSTDFHVLFNLNPFDKKTSKSFVCPMCHHKFILKTWISLRHKRKWTLFSWAEPR